MANERIAIQNVIYTRTVGLLYFVFVRAWPQNAGLKSFSINPDTPFNPLYNDPIDFGLRCADYPPLSSALVLDADVAKATGNYYGIASDLAEYRMIVTALGSFTQTDETVSARSQAWNSMANRFQTRMTALESLYKNRLKTATPEIGQSRYRLPIAEQGCSSEFGGGADYYGSF